MADVDLPPESQRRLIHIARKTLEDFVWRRPSKTPDYRDPYLDAKHYGAFVTLFKQEELRGCVGTCVPSSSLHDTVVQMTEASASRDRRVRPICAEELERIHIDISVLSRLAIADEPLSLEVGKHGLYIARERKRGVLLPQVAVEYEWDIKRFLEQACAKASLPKEAWSWPGTIVSSFTALVIEE
jgi:AmmeMemoRadiSam system protein A